MGIALCAFIGLAFALHTGAWAQVAACSVGRTVCIGPPCDLPNLVPPTAVCVSDLIVSCTWHIGGPGCFPTDAPPEAGCPSCAGKPINLATGNTFVSQTDIGIPGLGGGLALTRTWNSIWPSTEAGTIHFMFGPNWTSTYQERAFAGSDGYLKYARSDGSFWSFAVTSGANSSWVYGVVAPASAGATITTSSSNWTLAFKTGEQRVFDKNTGYLTSIIDRNGNTAQLTYDALPA
jgi:hypothetical protein